MTPEQRRIAFLERRVKLLRTDLIRGLVLGVGVFPMIFAQFAVQPVFALQAGILLSLILTVATNGLREFIASQREESLRKQDFLESLPPVNPKT